MKLSIIIPVYNEEKTIGFVLRALEHIQLKGITKEIVVVDDGSDDSTAIQIGKVKAQFTDIVVLTHKKNLGKGMAVRTGIAKANGDYILIQDADMEYHPADINRLLLPVLKKKSEVVYGTRLKRLPNFKKDERTFQFFLHYAGNIFLSFMTSVLYGQWVSDMETGYKLFPRDLKRALVLHARGFEFEPEITIRILQMGYTICEVPISTTPRSYSEGKKLRTFQDGINALWVLLKYRFVD